MFPLLCLAVEITVLSITDIVSSLRSLLFDELAIKGFIILDSEAQKYFLCDFHTLIL